MRQQASAFSPASVGNVGVGFDILGHVIEGVGDTVTVRRIDAPEVRITGIHGATVDLPLDAPGNTAGAALISLALIGALAGCGTATEAPVAEAAAPACPAGSC